jgi:hypothetical protein
LFGEIGELGELGGRLRSESRLVVAHLCVFYWVINLNFNEI